MSAIPYCDDVVPESVSLLQLPDVAKTLRLPVTRVHQMLRDRQLVAVKRDGVIGVPELFFTKDGKVVKQLSGLLIVLKDGGYSEEESLRWMFTEDDSLPGTPAAALRGHLAREVLRRAQAMAF
ncbi:Rv2175c family DNA-binding protein [Antrihabitans sp. YC2-6]|uniref:Rv2175c family DNA-binding protein n=1 Tax=Antrihabitans sp. YC2-6 TaxID=2799498 RepID=UPI0018F6FB93|nr:Rv2175c family DNA-binding protein [Antrihabitans sp. YC2-6]MBJ8343230.1 DNA-binding protein [Antrihabitans sp. YC2-6]